MLGWGVKEGLKGRRVTKGRKVVKGGMHSVGRKGYRKGGRKGGGGGGEILCGEGHVIAGLINTYPQNKLTTLSQYLYHRHSMEPAENKDPSRSVCGRK